MFGYLFIDNGNKPTKEQANSRENVKFDNFCLPCLEAALKLGFEVYYGVNRNNPEELESDMNVNFYDSHTYRSVTDLKSNYIAYKNGLDIIRKGKIEVIHCNTPIGGVIGRLCGKRMKVKRVIYTAHGFHFFKGAPMFNNIIYKFAEWVMAHWTDAIITMNEEDYKAAKKLPLKKGGKIFFVHGVGITLSDYENFGVEREKKRQELGLSNDQVAIVSAGDLVGRKDYATAIKSIAYADNPNIQYYICGDGPKKKELVELASSLGVSHKVHFLGFRKDVKEILYASDIFLFTTLQEGLPRSLMEAMATGLPCIASDIRGNIDLLASECGGYLCEKKNVDSFTNAINCLVADANKRKDMGQFNRERIKHYDINVVRKEIEDIYKDVLADII